MKVSVAMATFNAGEFLTGQLESLARQSRLPDELIVTDDGSTDFTIAALETFARTAAFEVRIERNPRQLGFAQNFGRALSLCSGDLVFLSDQDDYWLPNKIQTIADLAENKPAMHVFMNDAQITDEHLTSTGQTILSRTRKVGMSDDNFVHGSCMAIRRPLLDLALPIPEASASHDNWIVGLAIELGCRLIVEEPLQLYRRHGDATSQSITASTTPLSRAGYYCYLARRRRQSSTSDYLRGQLESTSLRLARVRERLARRTLEGGLRSNAVALEKNLEQRREALLARMTVLNKRRALRLPAVVAMTTKGQYAHFGGVLTAIRDLCL